MRRNSRKSQRTLFTTIGTAAVLAIVLAGCGSDDETPSGPAEGSWDDVLAAAKEEGKVSVVFDTGPGEEQIASEMAAALEPLGIEVEATFIDGRDLTSRLIAEQSAGEYLWDLRLGPTNRVASDMGPAGVVADIEPYIERIPDENKADDLWGSGFEWYDGDNRYAFLYSVATDSRTTINRTAAGDKIQGPEDLLDPEWSGKIAFHVTGAIQQSACFLRDPALGMDFLDKLFDQEPLITDGQGTTTEFLLSGRAVIGISNDVEDLQAQQEQGRAKDLEFELVDWCAVAAADGVTVFNEPPNPNAALVALNWTLSEEGQQSWVDNKGPFATSRRTDIPVKDTAKEIAPDYENLEQYAPITGTDEFVAAYNEIEELLASKGITS